MKVYIVLRNADFTEGRGPMLFDAVCKTKKGLIAYLNTKTSGIYGAKPEAGQTFAEWVLSGSAKHGGWAGYEVREENTKD